MLPDSRLAALVHREMVRLSVLIAVTAIAFLLTRTLAVASRHQNELDAREWFRRGQAAAAAGRLDTAAADFRRAASRRRGDRTYGLALAGALAGSGDQEGAFRELLALRASAPDDPDVNLALGRVAAARGDAISAERFYANALYAVWPPQRAEERRAVRQELIRFLIARGDRARALSELVALGPFVPDTAASHVEVARLFSQAGDERRALEHYRKALAAEPANQAALAGAGQAAFELEDYRTARAYLRRTNTTGPSVVEARELAELVLATDPLGPRLGSVERRRRLGAAMARAEQRLAGCAGRLVPAFEPGLLRAEVDGFRAALNRNAAVDQDAVENGLDLVNRAAAYADTHCGAPARVDRALELIDRLHREGHS